MLVRKKENEESNNLASRNIGSAGKTKNSEGEETVKKVRTKKY